jgi:hypothetical protein
VPASAADPPRPAAGCVIARHGRSGARRSGRT